MMANMKQSYDVTIECRIEGTSIESQNTLDLKNPYFRYTGVQPQPPPGENNQSPSEMYWTQVDLAGARQVRMLLLERRNSLQLSSVVEKEIAPLGRYEAGLELTVSFLSEIVSPDANISRQTCSSRTTYDWKKNINPLKLKSNQSILLA
jgi:hypothetical protein